MTPAPRPLRIFLYAQHLSGVGHWVRTFELGCELARHHDVTLIDGGRPVPRPGRCARPALLPLPRLGRGPDRAGVRALDPDRTLGEVWAERRRRLAAHVEAHPPDVVVVEHYPFSKWELGAEVTTLVDRVRAISPRARLVCSLRDIPRSTRHEPSDPIVYARAVLERLAPFDAVMVHGEAQLTPLAEHVPFAGDIPVPVHHTGYVVEPLAAPDPAEHGAPRVSELIVSVGGGASDLVERAAQAWRLVRGRGDVPLDRMCVHGALADPTTSDVHTPGFRDDFLTRLSRAALSLSHAGYNTCTNLLATGVRAVLVPHARMSDQAARAALFARLGLATVLPAHADCDALADAMRAALAAPAPASTIPLDGAARARAVLEQLTR